MLPVESPEKGDFHGAFLREDLNDDGELDMHPPRIRPRRISHEFVEARRGSCVPFTSSMRR